MSSTHGNELWAILLEKAYAKLHGSFERIAGGLSSDALRDLTFAPSFAYVDTEVSQDPENTWNMINEADHHGHIMSTGIGENNPAYEQLKLVAGHAYSVIAVAEVHDNNGSLTRIV